MYQELLENLVNLVLIPAIPILAVCISKGIKAYITEKTSKVENAYVREYLEDVNDLVCQVVVSTSQTYVEALKKEGKFDLEAQKVAFEKTKKEVLKLLTVEAKEIITNIYGDVDTWLDSKIEQMVNVTKKEF